MKKLVECSHTYNGIPVRISNRYNYGLDPSTVEVFAPEEGNWLIVPTKDLKLIPKGTVVMTGVVVDTKVSDEEDETKKKSEPKKSEKKKETKKAESKKTEKKAEKKEVKKSEPKKEKKKEVKKEDVTERIDNLLGEGWFGDKAQELKLSLEKAYTGTVEAIKDFMGLFKAGKTYLAIKKAGERGVKLFKNADDPSRNNPPIKIVPFEALNNWVKLQGMKNLHALHSPRLGMAEGVEEKIDDFLNEKKNFLGGIKKGAFHKWLGKDEDEPITDADIKKGLASEDPKVIKMANFAKISRKWKK